MERAQGSAIVPVSGDTFDRGYVFGRPVATYVSERVHARLLVLRSRLGVSAPSVDIAHDSVRGSQS